MGTVLGISDIHVLLCYALSMLDACTWSSEPRRFLIGISYDLLIQKAPYNTMRCVILANDSFVRKRRYRSIKFML